MKARIAIAAFALSSLGAIAATNMSTQGDTSQVIQLQQALNEKGFNVGAADGQMGAKTKAALKQFQQAQGLQASGQIDTQTLAALNITTGAQASTQSQSSTPSQSSTQTQPSAQAQPSAQTELQQQQQQPKQGSPSSQFSPQSPPAPNGTPQ